MTGLCARWAIKAAACARLMIPPVRVLPDLNGIECVLADLWQHTGAPAKHFVRQTMEEKSSIEGDP